MSKPKASGFKKTVLSASVATALGMGGASNSLADIYEFSFDNGGCGVDHTADFDSGGGVIDHTGDIFGPCTGQGDGVFTMLDPGGVVLQNTSYPYYGSTTWGYGLRTQIGGSVTTGLNGKLSIETKTGVGSAVIPPFEFFNKGAAVASNLLFKATTANGDGTFVDGLMLANMSFAWNGNVITTQVVWDAAGLFAELPTLADGPTITIGAVYDATSCTASGVCATPASEGIKKNKYPLGPAPIATSSFNTVGQSGVPTVLADLSKGTDDGIGGSPMDNGPFSGFNANFDFNTLTLTGYNDTTSPTLTITPGTRSVSINEGESFDATNPPGFAVTCTDAADGTETLPEGSNGNIFIDANTVITRDGTTIVGAVDGNTVGVYDIVYACNDNAERVARGDVLNPTNPGTAAVPNFATRSNNNSNSITLTVTVNSVGTPVITLLGSATVTHEACTEYTDAGATAVDGLGGAISPVVVTDNDSIIGPANILNVTEKTATIDYDITDNSVPAIQLTRTVNITDTLGPVITIEGGSDIILESSEDPAKNGSYTIPVATAVDANGDCNPVGGNAVTADTVNFSIDEGSDTAFTVLKYFATDSSAAENETQADQNVTVFRSEPVITLNGSSILTLQLGDVYDEEGIDVRDLQDGTLTAVTTSGTTAGTAIPPANNGSGLSGNLTHTIAITDENGDPLTSIDTSVSGGPYTVTYSVVDSDTHAATEVTRTINVGAFAENANFTMLDPDGLKVDGAVDVTVTWDGNSTSDIASTDFNMTIASATPTKFKGFPWVAHDIRTFLPGTYKFDTTCTLDQLRSGVVECNNPLPVDDEDKVQKERYAEMTVLTGQIGAHMLFNWGKTDPASGCGVKSCNIDVVVVWNQNAQWTSPNPDLPRTNQIYQGLPGEVGPALDAIFDLVSTDPDGDLANGVAMVDGPFIGFNANFNFNPDKTTSAEAIKMTAPDTKLGSMSWAGLIAGLLSLLSLGVYRKGVNRKVN